MEIRNKTKKTIIAKKYKTCSSLISQASGLMFSKKKDLIFIFPKEKRISLHMVFVFFPIWVVYLTKDKKVNFVKKLNPFTSFIYPKQKAKYILELTTKPSITINDEVEWE